MSFADQYIDKFKAANEKTKMMIFIGILVSLLLLDYFVLMRSQFATLSKISPENRVLAENIKKTKNDLLRLNDYRQKVKETKLFFIEMVID